MISPLDKLTTILARLMGKEPSDPDVLKAVADVVMAMREPSEEMKFAGGEAETMIDDRGNTLTIGGSVAGEAWQAMIDALLTEGEG